MPISAGRRARPGLGRMLGLLCLVAACLSGCVQQQSAGGPFPAFAEFQGEVVQDVSFAGELEVPGDSLLAVIQTRPTRCRFLFLPFCFPGTSLGLEEHRLDVDELARDVVRVQLYHRDHGYYGARVEPLVEEVDEGVSVEFFVSPGRQVILQDLLVEGTDTILDAEEIRDVIPLEEGDPFGRVNFLASADSIRQRLLRRGFVFADVLRNYSIDTIAGIAEAEFVALPGPLVFVDTVVIEGNERLSESTIRRQLTFGEGDPLLTQNLNESQRNLYSLAMINFASIRLDADQQTDAAEQAATVRVQVVEAAQYAVEASAGFGTVDCFRGNGRWTNRNFLGGGRTLDVTGSVSRIGVGDPLNFGLGGAGRPCTSIGEGNFLEVPGYEVTDQVDYRLGAEFQQPNILNTQNQVGVAVHSEHISEVNAYIRESIGGRLSIVRQLDIAPVLVSGMLEVDRGRTLADPTRLCVGFDTCTETDLERLSAYRWSNVLSTAATLDETPKDESQSGYLVRSDVALASSFLGSDDNYLRLLAEGAYYRPLQPGWVLAARLQLGQFIEGIVGSGDGYIPPERRFYAGGPSSVRGYSRNALGPTTYILPPDQTEAFNSATGGTRLIVTSLEVRMPSPWLRDIVRLAAFVDAGNVSDPGRDLYERRGLRVTPGAGVRFLTPVGPFRLDVAYNPYAREIGPLYEADPASGLILIDDEFQPEIPLLKRFRIQFALGQAF